MGTRSGWGEDLSLKERDAVRTPMQWGDEPNAGFSLVEKTVHPVINEGPCSYERVNVDEQRRDPDSLFNWTARMIRLRKECPEIGWGTWKILKTGSPHILAMRYDWCGNPMLILHNFDEKLVEVKIKPDVGGREADQPSGE